MGTELAPSDRIKTLVDSESIKKRFDDVLGKRSAAFRSSIVSAYAMNKKLAECDPMSVVSSAMIAATLDLPINPSLGMAHIVPYKGVGAFQIGWKGIVQLALRSGQYKTINATVIYEGQVKKHDQFTGEMEFNDERKSEKVIGYLLFFRLINGFEKYHYWTKEQCQAHGKRYSQAYKSGFGPWVDMFDEMALKTVVKLGLLKYGILSVHMQDAIEKDESYGDAYPDAVPTTATTPTPAAPEKTKSSRLRDAIETTAAPAAQKKVAEKTPPAVVNPDERPPVDDLASERHGGDELPI